MHDASANERRSIMKKVLMLAALTLGLAIPSLALASSGLDPDSDGSWCPCCN
jgi:hypothetical protein